MIKYVERITIYIKQYHKIDAIPKGNERQEMQREDVTWYVGRPKRDVQKDQSLIKKKGDQTPNINSITQSVWQTEHTSTIPLL